MEYLLGESKMSINVVLPVYRFGHKHWGPDGQTARRRHWPWASMDPVLGRPPFIGRWITRLVIATLLVAPAAKAFAQSGKHGDSHAQMHDIYQHWHPPLNPGTSCCNNADCRPTPRLCRQRRLLASMERRCLAAHTPGAGASRRLRRRRPFAPLREGRLCLLLHARRDPRLKKSPRPARRAT